YGPVKVGVLGCGEHEIGEHALHALDLRGLIGEYIGGEAEHRFFLSRAARGKQLIHHGDGALVMPDHVLQEQPVELRAAGWIMPDMKCTSAAVYGAASWAASRAERPAPVTARQATQRSLLTLRSGPELCE